MPSVAAVAPYAGGVTTQPATFAIPSVDTAGASIVGCDAHVFIGANDKLAITPPAGWAPHETLQGTGAHGVYRFSKRLVQADLGTSVTFPYAGAALVRTSGVMVIVRDGHLTPGVISTLTPTAAAAASTPIPSAVAPTAGTLMLTFLSVRYLPANATGITVSGVGWNEIFDSATTNSTANKAGGWCAWKLAGPPVATSATATATDPATTAFFGGFTIGILPQPRVYNVRNGALTLLRSIRRPNELAAVV